MMRSELGASNSVLGGLLASFQYILTILGVSDGHITGGELRPAAFDRLSG